MRPDHTITDFAQPQPILATQIDSADEMPATQLEGASTLGRVTFCFAWLFGLEAFLTGTGND